MATDLYLVRHGEAVSNVEPVIAGMTGDRGLTARGRAQAALLEQRLRAERWQVDRLLSSTLPRAVETAAYVARAVGLPVQHEDDLHELRPGAADGLTVDEWRARYRAGEDPTPDPHRAFSPGGESWVGFLERATAALSSLVTRYRDERVLVVCHGGVVEASFALAFATGAGPKRVRCEPRNTAVTHWRHVDVGPGEPAWTLLSFDDAEHLRDRAVG